MGVLKVNVGDAVTPVWRNTGCGGSSGSSSSAVLNANWDWTTEPTPDGNTTFSWHAVTAAPSSIDIYFEYLDSGGGLHSGSTGVSRTSGTFAESWYDKPGGIGIPAGSTLTHVLIYDSFGSGDKLSWDYTPPTTGRLKLWTGTQWVREACDDDLGFVFSDDFARADETPIGSPYAHAGSANLTSGEYVCASSTCSIFYTRTGPLDGYVEATVTAATSGNHHLLVSMVNGTGTAYIYFGFDNLDRPFIGGLPLGGSDAVRAGPLSSPLKTNGQTYVMRLTRSGDTYTATLDGTDLLTYTDSAFSDCGAIAEIGLGSGETCEHVEILDGVPAHPLKVNVGTPSIPDWQVVARMVPA